MPELVAARTRALRAILGAIGYQLVFILDKLETLIIDGEQGFDANRLLPKIDVSYKFLQERLAFIDTRLAALPEDLPDIAIPFRNVTSVLERLTNHEKSLKGLQVHFASVEKIGPPKPTTWEKITIASTDNSHSTDLVDGYLEPLLTTTDLLLGVLSTLDDAVGPKTINLTQITAEMSQATLAVKEALRDAKKAAENANAEQAAATEQLKSLTVQHQSAIDAAVELRRIRDEVVALDGDVKGKKAQADVILTAAAALSQQVEQYTAQFTALQKAMDDRLAALTKGDEDMWLLMGQLREREAEIAKIVDKAETMLATATNAGLTHAQEDKYNQLGKQLFWAGLWVFAAYLALFASLYPVVVYVLEPTTIEFRDFWTYLGNVLARAVLLIPGSFAARFATRRYMQLFRLRHEYGYRAALAGAVHGFKTQASRHAEDIAAAAFYQLGLNPAATISGKQDIPPWFAFLTPILDRFGKGFGRPEETK